MVLTLKVRDKNKKCKSKLKTKRGKYGKHDKCEKHEKFYKFNIKSRRNRDKNLKNRSGRKGGGGGAWEKVGLRGEQILKLGRKCQFPTVKQRGPTCWAISVINLLKNSDLYFEFVKGNQILITDAARLHTLIELMSEFDKENRHKLTPKTHVDQLVQQKRNLMDIRVKVANEMNEKIRTWIQTSRSHDLDPCPDIMSDDILSSLYYFFSIALTGLDWDDKAALAKGIGNSSRFLMALFVCCNVQIFPLRGSGSFKKFEKFNVNLNLKHPLYIMEVGQGRDKPKMFSESVIFSSLTDYLSAEMAAKKEYTEWSKKMGEEIEGGIVAHPYQAFRKAQEKQWDSDAMKILLMYILEIKEKEIKQLKRAADDAKVRIEQRRVEDIKLAADTPIGVSLDPPRRGLQAPLYGAMPYYLNWYFPGKGEEFKIIFEHLQNNPHISYGIINGMIIDVTEIITLAEKVNKTKVLDTSVGKVTSSDLDNILNFIFGREQQLKYEIKALERKLEQFRVAQESASHAFSFVKCDKQIKFCNSWSDNVCIDYKFLGLIVKKVQFLELFYYFDK